MARILIADDCIDLRTTMGDLLRANGHEVEVCADGAAALDAQQSAPFDVLITDIFMPNKDGVEIVSEFHEKHPQTRIIAMSGSSLHRVDYLSLTLKLGASGILRKPFDLGALKALLQEVIAHGNEVGAGEKLPQSSGRAPFRAGDHADPVNLTHEST